MTHAYDLCACLQSLSLNSGHLLALAGRGSDVQILCPRDFDVGGGKEDFDMAWVTLVWVATSE